MAASKRAGGSPIRRALASTSPLQTRIREGLEAVKRKDRVCLSVDVRGAVGDSLDIDVAFQKSHPEVNRWDYLLGHLPSGQVIGLEPHSAKQDEISTVIRKKKAALQQLAGHLKPGKSVSK